MGGSCPQRDRDRREDFADLRIAEAHRFDVTIENGKVTSYRVRLNVSFKYEPAVTRAQADNAEEWEHTRHELE